MMEGWNGGRVLPHRHREHIERKLERWKNGLMEKYKHGGTENTEK